MMYSSAHNIICVGLVLSCISLSVQNKRVKRIVGGRYAAIPPPDDPVIFARAYNRHARVEGDRYVFVHHSNSYY